MAAKIGLTASKATSVASDQFNLITQGSDYYADGMFLRNVQNGEISRYSGGQFHLVSVPVAMKLGLSASNVATITADQYNKVTKGNDYFPEGMLIQNVQTGEVDLYSGGQRHWISVPVGVKIGMKASDVTTISASQFNGVPQGNDYFPDGAFLQNQVTGEISQYSGGTNHVVSAPVAVVMGLTSAQWISVTPSQYSAIPTGSNYYPEGIFVRNNQTGEIDQVSGGQRHWVSPAAQEMIALASSKVAVIGADQFNAIPRSTDYVPPTTSSSNATNT